MPYWKPLSDLSHFFIKDSIINIIIIIIINFNIIIIIILIIIAMVHASHGRCVNAWNFSPIIMSQQAASKDPRRIFADILFQAFGWVRREGREREKKKKSKEGERGERVPSLSPLTHSLGVFFFFFSHLFVVSPRSERLEQTTLLIPETLNPVPRAFPFFCQCFTFKRCDKFKI